ncbi:MAG TPA: hypothetical protein VLX92_28590 [Kofleriaceae bacterium]|nr:hypothetical protein [Kofleriaceae bacterium]
MKRLLYVTLALLPACMGGERNETGQCPAGEVCSPATPDGLYFVGRPIAGDIELSGPAPTAIGGTQAVELEWDDGGATVAFGLPYAADDDGGIGVKVDHTSGAVVTLDGVGSRTNYLRITDPSDGSLYDRKEMTGAAIDHVELATTDFETVPDGLQLAWVAGPQQIGVALFGQVQEDLGPVDERIVDDSMQLQLDGAQPDSWDMLDLANAAPGSYTVSVVAGGASSTLDLEIVAGPDAVGAMDPPASIPPQGEAELCFAATAGARYVAGLTWTYTVDGQQVVQSPSTYDPNCLDVGTDKTSGSVVVTASAGGQQTSLTLPVSSSAARVAARRAVPVRPVEGERAAAAAAR